MKRSILLCAPALALAACVRAPHPQPTPELVVHSGKYEDRNVELASRPVRPDDRLPAARFQQEVHRLHERVSADPAFGGLILRWSPEPHAVVMFTGDAEARLRRYTSDPRFRAQRVELTLAELERMKDRFGVQLARLGLRCFSVDGDEEHNMVTVGAPATELERVRAAIRAREVQAPARLRLVEQGCAEFR